MKRANKYPFDIDTVFLLEVIDSIHFNKSFYRIRHSELRKMEVFDYSYTIPPYLKQRRRNKSLKKQVRSVNGRKDAIKYLLTCLECIYQDNSKYGLNFTFNCDIVNMCYSEVVHILRRLYYE